MAPLILSILCSSIIFVLFKLFPRFGVDTFQAIVFNYVTAFLCGILFFGHEWNPHALESGNWPLFVLLAAALFISLFILMGLSSQKNGVAMTSIAVKMSMAISLILMIVLYNEDLGWMKVAGIALAFTGVFLVSYTGKSNNSAAKSEVWMLATLFIGSGILDFILNYVQKHHLEHLTPSLFSAFGFGGAGLIGFAILMTQIFRKQASLSIKNIVAGVALGIPNYFSIYLLMESYRSTGWNDSTVLAVINVSIVMISSVIGFIAFKENVTIKKIIGLVAAIAAIVVLYLASQS
jgi:drug/metabolite transporter (DMT)-like permease